MKTNRRNLNACLTGCALLLGASLAGALPGDLAKKWPVNEENPAASIPDAEERNKDPLEFGYWLQDLIARAEGGFEGKKYDEAIRYYEALAKAVPDKAVTFRRLCTAHERLGNLRKAEANCWAVLKRKGVVVQDHLHLMRLALSQISEGSPAVTEERTRMIDASADHVRKHIAATSKEEIAKLDPKKDDLGDSEDLELPLDLQVALIECRLAVKLRDAMRLQQCVDTLHDIKADPKVAIPFQWTYAVAKGDQARIDQVLLEAKKLGMPEAAIKAMAEGPKTLPPPPEQKPADDNQAGLGLIEPAPPNDSNPEAPAATPSESVVARSGFDLEAWIAGLAGFIGLAAGGWLVWQRSGSARKGLTAPIAK